MIGIRSRVAGAGLIAALSSCDEPRAEIPLRLSKNCNEVEVQVLVSAVGDAPNDDVLDVAANGAQTDTAWVLVRRAALGENPLELHQIGPRGVQQSTSLPPELAGASPSSLHLVAAPSSGQVWVVRDEPQRFKLWRVEPNHPTSPVIESVELQDFPHDTELCDPCDASEWPRRLIFIEGAPRLLAMPTFSNDSELAVWVGQLEIRPYTIELNTEHRLAFRPPCPFELEEQCEESPYELIYPTVTLMGVQDEPRQDQVRVFGHRTRRETYDGSTPLESADVFMVSLFADSWGIPQGILRSYSGFYGDGPLTENVSPFPTAHGPRGIAVDPFASYGLFSNSGVTPRLVQLPDLNLNFNELTGDIPLTVDSRLIQLDQDVALGRIVDHRWELTKLFPDAPEQSKVTLYQTDAPIEAIVAGGIGTFMLRKRDAAAEIVRVSCVRDDDSPN